MRHQAVGLHRCCRPSRLHPRKHGAWNLSTRISFLAAFFPPFRRQKRKPARGVVTSVSYGDWRRQTSSRSRPTGFSFRRVLDSARKLHPYSVPQIAPVSPCARTLMTRRSSALAVATPCDERSAVQKHQISKKARYLEGGAAVWVWIGAEKWKFPSKGHARRRSCCMQHCGDFPPTAARWRGGGRLEEGLSELASTRPETGVSRVRSG